MAWERHGYGRLLYLVAFDTGRIIDATFHQRRLVLWLPFSHETFANLVTAEASPASHGLMHLDHCRVLAVADIALEGAGPSQ